MAVGSFIFSAAPTKQPRTSFPFYNSFIQPSLVGSLFGRHQEATEDFFCNRSYVKKSQQSHNDTLYLVPFSMNQSLLQ